MRKRIFSRLMAMFMAVALLSTSALAFDVNQDYIESLTVKSDKYKSWVDLSEKSDGASDYTLVGDINTEHTLRFSGRGTNATLDLAGHTIDHLGKDGSVIQVDGRASLTINDSSEEGTGTITGGTGSKGFWYGTYGGGIYVSDANLTMNGGNVLNNSSTKEGGGIYVNQGSISLEDTTIAGNVCEGIGGGLSINDATKDMVMKDCVIANNQADGAGGLFAGGYFSITITDSTIAGNTARDAGGMHVQNRGSTTMSGGYFVENTTTNSPNSRACEGCQMDSTVIQCANDGEPHSYAPATCTQPKTCTVCGKTEGKALGHVMVTDPEVPATCTKTGLTAGSHCSRCSHAVAQEIIPATGHTYAPATCTEPETCHCGATEGEALGHDMGEWVVTTPARPGVAGEETRTCSRCDHTETQPIPALPMPIDFGDTFPGGAGADTTINDEATPLAGIVTEAQLLDALYEHEGSPEVEILEKYAAHEYAPAISWALANAVEADDEDFDPDEVLTVGLLREVLVNFAEYKGIEFTVTVTGEDDEIVMNLSERLNAFYKELEETMEEKAA